MALLLPVAAFAQTAATMPVFYNAQGQQVNGAGSAALPAGYYYLQPNGQGQQVYYYGNGTYYDPSIGQYGGSVSNPNGTAGANLGYTNGTVGQYDNTTTPGVPNTGAGGGALAAWLTLILAGSAVVLGVMYLGWSRRNVLS